MPIPVLLPRGINLRAGMAHQGMNILAVLWIEGAAHAWIGEHDVVIHAKGLPQIGQHIP
jgi:hypothetical protein